MKVRMKPLLTEWLKKVIGMGQRRTEEQVCIIIL